MPPGDAAAAQGARRLAQELLARERGAAEQESDCLAAAGRVVDRLHDHLSVWFGEDGFDALLMRSLDRARALHEPLSHVRREARGVLDFSALAERVRGRPPDEVNEIVLALLEIFITLLGRMLGNDLAGRLIEQSWVSDSEQAQAAAPEPFSDKRSTS